MAENEIKSINGRKLQDEKARQDIASISVPTKTSELENDSNFVTDSEVDTKITNASLGGGLSIRDVIENEIFSIFGSSDPVDTPVLVQGISLNNNTLNLKVNEKSTLIATITPSNATNKNVTWTINNDKITKSENGLNCEITCVSEGSSIITVTTEDGSYSATCNVTITASSTEPIEPSNTYITDSLLLDIDTRNILISDTEILDKTDNNNDFAIINSIASNDNSWTPDKSGAYCKNLITLDDNFSIETYIKPVTNHNNKYIQIGKDTWSNDQMLFALSGYGNNPVSPLQIIGANASANYYPQFDLLNYVNTTDFHHIVITKEGTTLKAYINGSLVETFTLTNNITLTNVPLGINCRLDDNIGTIIASQNTGVSYKMLRIYNNKVLTSSEVTNNYSYEINL